MLREVRSGNQCLTGRVLKTQILLLRNKSSYTKFLFLYNFSCFSFDYFWVNLGRNLRFAGNQGIQEKH